MSTGGGQSIGGISAEVELSTGNLDAQLTAVQGRLDRVAQAMQRWLREFEAGKITAQQLDAALGPLVAEQDALRAAMDRTTQAMASQAAATTKVHTGMATVSTGTAGVAAGGKNAALGLLTLSYAVDDLQYGFRAIVNNIPGVVMGLGGSAGIAGAVAIAGVGINQLINHWDDLTAAFGEGTPHVRTAADEMEELAKKTEKTVRETERLALLQKQAADRKPVAAGESREQKQTGQLVQEFFDEAGGLDVKHKLMDVMMPIMSPEEKAEIRKAGEREHVGPSEFGEVNLLDPETAAVQRAIKTAEIQERHRKIAEDRALELMRQAKQAGPEGRMAREQIATFPGLGRITEATPEALRQREDAAQDAAEQFEMREQMRKQGLADEEERRRLGEEAFEESTRHIGSQGRARVEARRAAHVREAEEAFPGISDVAVTFGRTALAQGIPMDVVREQLSEFLQSRDIAGGKGRADELAKDLTHDTEKDLRREAVQRELAPQKSQVFDAADLAARIQSGVGGEEVPKQQLGELKTIRQSLDDLKNKGLGFNPTVQK